jgi:hypothetical protein
MVSIAALTTAIRERFSGSVGDGNAAAAEAAHQLIVAEPLSGHPTPALTAGSDR